MINLVNLPVKEHHYVCTETTETYQTATVILRLSFVTIGN